jgi:hypothetical protein
MSLTYSNGYWVNMRKPGGQVFFVGGSVAAYRGLGGSDSYDGLNPQRPLSTISGALNKCVSGRGDTIVLLPGSITVTSAISITVDDVTIQSYDDVMPHCYSPSIITAAATYNANVIQIDANNVTLRGIGFEAGFTTVTANQEVIQINSTDATDDVFGAVIENCYFDMTRAAGAASAADNDLDCIRVGLDSNDRAFNTVIRGCVIKGCDQDAISISAGTTGCLIENNHIFDGVGSELTRIGVSLFGVGNRVIGNKIMCGTDSDTAGPISVGVTAALAQVYNNNLVAWSTNTVAITVVNTATVFSSGNWLLAVNAGNLVDFKTAATTPSASADVGNVYAADPALAAFTQATVAGS